MNNLATVFFLMGDYAQAESNYRESLSIRKERLGDDNSDTANSKNNLADMLNRLGQYEEAEQLASEAAESYASVFSPSYWRAAVARNIHGASLTGLGRYEEAELLLTESNDVIGEARAGSIYHRMAVERTIELYDAWEKPGEKQQYERQLSCIEQKTDC